MLIHNSTCTLYQCLAKKIEDLDIDTLQEMLKYIYAGTIDKLSTRSGRLLEAAEKYQLPELKRICEVWNKCSLE